MRANPSADLRELCAATAARLADPGLRRRLDGVRARLGAPLQVAVAGAVSSGKSTLVNALLGLPVATVAPGECTPFVTQYEYGLDDGRVEIERADGRIAVTRLAPGRRLPADLGVPVDEVMRVRVHLRSEALRAVTVIDSPGMNTITAHNERAARRLLFGTDEDDDQAQALIYVLRYVQRFDDEILTEFRRLTEACGMSRVNTLAVLSQVDRRGDEDDPWPTARRLAARAYADLRASVFDVVPVIGLLAETARIGALGHRELAALSALAELDDADLDYLLLDLDDFVDSPEVPVPTPVRRELVRRLHRYGIRTAVTALRNGTAGGVEALNRILLQRSGFESAEPSPTGTVAAGLAHFTRRAEQLKALAAIAQLRRLSRALTFGSDRTILGTLATALEESQQAPAVLHSLLIHGALEAAGRGQLVLNDEMRAELARLAGSDDPAERLGLPVGATAAEVAEAARAASVRWRALAMLGEGRVGGQRARDVLRVLEDLATAPEPAQGSAPPTRSAPAETPPAPPLPPVPPVPIDEEHVRRLRDSALLTAEDRRTLDRLLTGTGAAAQVGAALDAPAQDVAAFAAVLSARFRALMHRPLPLRDRRAVEAVCDAFARISQAILHAPQGDTTHGNHR
ncbi:dynamin family protein [Thermopolyspora sp. NPDC052614]|uniref:dynamin family protein n=1 Tax=Thermopolyspora sp. NPDC052614 TaxID=3155682 RepID=UPI00342A2881